MDIISKRRVVADRWRHELDPIEALATALIPAGDVIVSAARWVSDWEALLARGTRVGVCIAGSDELDRVLATQPQELWLVEFHFASFADGRAYSQARLLRSRHDFHGIIRASGDVSPDRLSFMARCGFDEFQLPEGGDPAVVLRHVDGFSARYQPDRPGDDTVARRRGFRVAGAVSSAA